MADMSIFGLQFENTIVMFEICVPEFVLLKSLVQKEKLLNFRAKLLDLDIFGQKLKIISSYLKSVTSNLSNCKILGKNKNA